MPVHGRLEAVDRSGYHGGSHATVGEHHQRMLFKRTQNLIDGWPPRQVSLLLRVHS